VAVLQNRKNETLDENINVIIHPHDDYDDGMDYYWLGFGLSSQGGMIGADMMIYLPPRHVPPPSDSTGSDTGNNGSNNITKGGRLLDAHGVAYSFPVLDECGQDWQLVNATIMSGSTNDDDQMNAWHVVEAKRLLRSNDVNEDLPFIDDSSTLINPTHVVAAWGPLNMDEEESDGRSRRARAIRRTGRTAMQGDEYLALTSAILPHEPSSRVSSTVRFFAAKSDHTIGSSGPVDDDGHNNLLESNTPYIDLIPHEPFLIPDEVTIYKNFCFRVEDYPELMDVFSEQDDGQVHIVAFHDILTGEAGSSSLVHHMDLHGTTNEVLSSDMRLCRVYTDLIHPWEAGSPRTFELPGEAGIPLGKDGYLAFRVEVHYHNPRRRSGILDQSGVRLYYSATKRPHVAGLMLLGDYMLELRGSYTVGRSDMNFTATNTAAGMRHSFHCPPPCFSGIRLGGMGGVGAGNASSSDNNITVFREVLHMHKSGERMTNIHLDAGGNVVRASEANRFDFSQGAGYASRVGLPYRINEGDSFLTTCYFSTRGVVWGSSSDQEMCQTFMWYYPKREYSLTCGYLDVTARKRGPVNSLDPVGCEMGYDRAEVAASANLDRLNPNEECQAPADEFSSRSFDSFEPLTASGLKVWPSLMQLVNTWKQKVVSAESTTELTNSTVGSSPRNNTLPPSASGSNTMSKVEDCCLCPNGQRPTRPETIVTGFSWTCDELDAAIPVLHTRPELLLLSASDVAPCDDYRTSFGELCGCPAEAGQPENAIGSSMPGLNNEKLMLSGGTMWTVLTLFMLALIPSFLRRWMNS